MCIRDRDKLYFDPDIPPSRADLILSAVRDGRDWGDSFEGSLSLYSAVSRHIHSLSLIHILREIMLLVRERRHTDA